MKLVTKEMAVEFFGKDAVDLAERFYQEECHGNLWDETEENKKRDFLLRGGIHSGMDAHRFRSLYDSLQIKLSPDDMELWANELQRLQLSVSGGHGISYLESIVFYIKNGKPHYAKRICQYDGDKIFSHPVILLFLKATLMKNENDWYPRH